MPSNTEAEVVKDDYLVQLISDDLDMPKAQVAQMIKSLKRNIVDIVEDGDELRLHGLFTISVADTAPRTGRNPSTGKPVQIEASKRVSIKPSKVLKDAAKGLRKAD